MSNLFWSDKSIFPIFIFCKFFLTSQTCWKSFLHENLTMTVGFFLLILWQDSMRSVGILHTSLSKMATTFSSKASTSTSLEMITIPRHSRLEYCAFNQHWCSIVTSLLNRIVLTCFVTNTSVCDLEKDSFNQSINQSINQGKIQTVQFANIFKHVLFLHDKLTNIGIMKTNEPREKVISKAVVKFLLWVGLLKFTLYRKAKPRRGNSL